MKYLLLNLPNPPGKIINREFAGGFGTAGAISSDLLLPGYLLYGASAVDKMGFKYEIIDAQGMNYTSFEIIDEAKKLEPDVLITWVSLPSLNYDLNVIKEIKKTFKSLFIVVLGAASNVIPEEILKTGDVDIAVKGNYPYYNLVLNLVQTLNDNSINNRTVYKVAGASYIKDKQIEHNPIEPYNENLDNLSFHLYRKIPITKYINKFELISGSTVECIPIVTAVGCPHSCIYCPYPIGYGNRVQKKSIQNIIAEIKFLQENFGIKGFMFRDQNFTRSEKLTMEFCDRVIEEGMDIKWMIESRIDQVTKELLTKMHEAGCFRIHFGVETGEPNILEKIGKPGINIEDVKNAFRMTREAGIYTVAHLIIGLPGESEETLENTSNLLKQINPDNINLNVLTPYPGTKLYENALQNGWITSKDWSEYTSYNSVMNTGDMSAEQLNNLRTLIKKKFRNWKISHDPIYRKLFIKSLPRRIKNRFVPIINKH